MNTWRFLLAPLFCLFDLKIYREVCNEKFGKGVLYSLYLAALFCSAFGLLGISFMPQVKAFVSWLKAEYPPMTFSHTGIKLDTPGKVSLTHPRFGMVAVFDDTRQTITDEEMGQALIYVTATMIYVRNETTIQARSLVSIASKTAKENKQIHLDGKVIESYFIKLKWPLLAVFVGVMFIFGFVSRLITGLIFAGMGHLIQLAIPRNLDFEKLFILASFSFSIGLLFSIFQYVPGVARFFPGGLGLLLSVVYFGIAIAVQPKPLTVE